MKHCYYDNTGALINEIDEADLETSCTNERPTSDLDEIRLGLADLAALVISSTASTDSTSTEGSAT